jgi:hypothetical protein
MENSLFDHDHDNIDDFSSYLQRICSSESFIAWAVKFGYWESQPFYTLSPSDERPNDCISYKLTLADVESQMLTDNSTFIDSIFQSAFSSHAIQASGKAEIGGFHRAPLMTKWEKVLTRYIPEALVYQNRKAFWEFVLPYIVRIFKARIEQQKIDTGTLTGNEFSRTRRSNRLRDRRTESYLPSWDFDGECMLAKSYLAGY